MMARRLDRIVLNVGHLAAAIAFYTDALGFHAGPVRTGDPAIAAMLGVQKIHLSILHRGGQRLELAACEPPGVPYPAERSSDDLTFQHCAIVTDNIRSAYDRLCRTTFTAISRQGPQMLPDGITAFKFRDPDQHPLELIQFPAGDPRSGNGIDHSAIVVADPDCSIAFYVGMLGLSVGARQLNRGIAQDALDGLATAVVDVVALTPRSTTPHLELLGYHPARQPPASRPRPADIAASRLVFEVDALWGGPPAVRLSDGSFVALGHDPDGHGLQLEQRGAAP